MLSMSPGDLRKSMISHCPAGEARPRALQVQISCMNVRPPRKGNLKGTGCFRPIPAVSRMSGIQLGASGSGPAENHPSEPFQRRLSDDRNVSEERPGDSQPPGRATAVRGGKRSRACSVDVPSAVHRSIGLQP
jgi:hypothetical protein